MRKIFAMAAVLAITSAQAAEELKFGDLNYFLKAGQINAVADVNSSLQRSKFQGTTTEARGVITNGTLAYALTNQLNAFVGVSYAYDLQIEDKTTTSNADVDRDGFSNPALGVNYRVMNQNEARYNFDLGAIARINVQDAESATSVGQKSKNGNFANGRSSLELNARMGRKWNEANEWQLAAGVNYFNDGESTHKTPAGNSDLDEKASVDAFLRTSYQYRPVNEFMMLLSLQGTRVGEADVKIKNGNKVTSDSHFDVDFLFTAKYLITENFIGKFNYSNSRKANYDVKDGTSNDAVSNRLQNFFGLGVDFLF
jgi:hypothetical protein